MPDPAAERGALRSAAGQAGEAGEAGETAAAEKEASGNRGRRGTPTAKPLAQKGKMSPRKKAAFAKKRNGK